MRRSAAVFVLTLAMSACAHAPSPGPRSGSPAPALDERRLAIYERLIREVAGAEDLGQGTPWDRVVIVSMLCENAAEPFPPEGCDERFSEMEQVELTRRLESVGSTVTFVSDPTPIDDLGGPGSVIIRVGPIGTHGAGVAVGGSYVCGGLCGSGTTFLLEESPKGWEVVGSTGTAWIA
jgi:hypothetical protein